MTLFSTKQEDQTKTTEKKVKERRKNVLEEINFRFKYFNLNKKLADLISEKGNEEEAINTFFENNFSEDKNFLATEEQEVFFQCVDEDFSNFGSLLSQLIEDKNKIITKKDFFILMTFYSFLLHLGYIEESEITKSIGVSFDENKERPIIDESKKPENVINLVIISLHDFITSYKKGILQEKSDNEEEVLVHKGILYCTFIFCFNNDMKNFVNSASTINKKKSVYSTLINEENEIAKREINDIVEETETEDTEGTNDEKDKKIHFSFTVNKKKVAKNVEPNNPDPDLSGLSTSNKRKDTSTEFLNNEAEEVPILEVAK